MSVAHFPNVSIIIRALDEAEFLPECLTKVLDQEYPGLIEIVLVDSGSTDGTIEIGQSFGCNIVHIKKSNFSFGRSLNMGCSVSGGEILVFLSAHCMPVDSYWLQNLIEPILDGTSEYSYGRQIARESVSKFSEGMVFRKYYPEKSSSPQIGYFCNNANSAIKRSTWDALRFNEELTGLEDMELAKRLTALGGTVSYKADGAVEHIHCENWTRIKIRYEREAVAMTDIDAKLHLSFWRAFRMLLGAIISDIYTSNVKTVKALKEIILYRFFQYWGSYIGGSASRKKIEKMQNEYFYPKQNNQVVTIGDRDANNSAASNEGA